jgi:endonuclease/exonuclease/phosphatase family metal-dependent hydrolase
MGVSMRKYRSKLARSLLFLLNSYGFALSLLILLWFFTGERLFFVNVFISVTPAIFYALPFALFLAILLKSRRSIYFLLIPSVICFVWYAPRFLPRSIENAQGQELVLLSYNLYAGNHNYSSLDTILSEADADIVSLQEVNWETANWLEATWTDEYPYYVRYVRQHGMSQYTGRFLLSRYPITDYEIVNSVGIDTKLYIRAELDVLGQALTVYNIHMPPPSYRYFNTFNRSESVTRLLTAAKNDETVILMGDFNMTDQSEDYRRMSSAYQDVFVESATGLGTSFPNGRRYFDALPFLPSMIRIDYMFLSEDFAPQESRVLREGASDHFPLWARVILED